MRETSDAKLAMMMRPPAWLKTASKASSTTRSDGVHPGRSELVESARSASTPRWENSARRAKSLGQLSTGVVIELVISCMHDQPCRRFNTQADSIRDGMANMEKGDCEGTDLANFAGLYSVQVDP